MSRNKYPEQTIEKILSVSLQLFTTKGYEKTTIQDIVEQLGMSKGAIYHHFKSKEDILNALFEKTYEQDNYAKQMEIMSRNISGLEKIRAIFRIQLDDNEKRAVDNIMVNFVKDPRMLVANLKKMMNESSEMASQLIILAMEDGSIKKQDPVCATQVVMLLVNFWIAFPIEGYDEDTMIRKVHYLRFLLESIGAPIIDDEIEMLFINYFKNCYISYEPAA